MSRHLQLHPRRPWRLPSPAPALVALGWLAAASGCGGIPCPAGFNNVDGLCLAAEPSEPGEPDAGVMEPPPREERCDGVDNDGDDAIDELWPTLGESCGEGGGRGECVLGEVVCAADGRGVVCDGAVGPTPEVCDGLDNDCDGVDDNGPAEVCDGEDNDCDGLVDDGVLSVLQEQFAERATVAPVDGGFVVTRMVANMLRVETYRTDATRTGHHDDIDDPSAEHTFVESDAWGGRVLIALGKHRFHVVEAYVDADLVPVIADIQTLHEDWDQGIDFGIYNPPFHPRVTASPPRFLGYQNLVTFALSPFGYDRLRDLGATPIEAKRLPYHAHFDTAGAFAVWELSDNVRAGWLLDDGELLVDIDVARGVRPAIAVAEGGPGVAYLQDGKLLLSELVGATLRCAEGRFCGAPLDTEPIEPTATTALALAHDDIADRWVVAANEQVWVVGRGKSGPVVQQSLANSVGDEPPVRIDVAVSGGTAAIIQTAEQGDTALTFMGCF